MDIVNTIYTVNRCRKNSNNLYGASHGSDDGETTVCGLNLDHNWYITNNTFDGKITCKKCLKIIKVPPNKRT